MMRYCETFAAPSADRMKPPRGGATLREFRRRCGVRRPHRLASEEVL